MKITSPKDDEDFEFLHLFVRELMKLNTPTKKIDVNDLSQLNNMLAKQTKQIEYVRLNSETKLYNLIFDNHYEVSVGNMKFLSHHPNHLNRNKYLIEGREEEQPKRTKKIYAIEGMTFFDKITLKDLLKQKPNDMTDKEYLASVLRFN